MGTVKITAKNIQEITRLLKKIDLPASVELVEEVVEDLGIADPEEFISWLQSRVEEVIETRDAMDAAICALKYANI